MRRRTWVMAAAGTAAGAVALGGGFVVYLELLKAGHLRYNEWDRRQRGDLWVGSTAPDLELPMYDGRQVRLSQLWTDRPLFLVFGSCT